MSKLPHDINDDEIRIISSANSEGGSPAGKPRKSRLRLWVLILLIVSAAAAVTALILASGHGDGDSEEPFRNEVLSAAAVNDGDSIIEAPRRDNSYVAVSDTTIDGNSFSIFTPVNVSPMLHVGSDILSDSTAIFVVQAADIRGDNGKIVGAYVLEGELVSRGQTKSGYCAIIGGKISVGVADSTPLLEQALETDGYFFRQYPLVVANQIVENKPKGRSLRKALAELNGEIVVIMSHDRLSFHDFSQSLVDMGVSNAIYLIGSSAYGFARDADGRKIEFGRIAENSEPNTNYIVWK